MSMTWRVFFFFPMFKLLCWDRPRQGPDAKYWLWLLYFVHLWHLCQNFQNLSQPGWKRQLISWQHWGSRHLDTTNKDLWPREVPAIWIPPTRTCHQERFPPSGYTQQGPVTKRGSRHLDTPNKDLWPREVPPIWIPPTRTCDQERFPPSGYTQQGPIHHLETLS